MKIIGLNSKCYSQGSTFPAYTNNIIRVYGMRFCPYVERVLLTLVAKGLDFEVINIDLKNKPDWYLKSINKLGKVPSVQFNNEIVVDSAIVAEWIDDAFEGTKKVLPQHEPYRKAQQKMLFEKLKEKLPTLSFWFRDPSNEKWNAIVECIKFWENCLDNDFFCGDAPGYVDYMAWPHLARCQMLALIDPEEKVFEKTCPKLNKYMERMKARPEVQLVSRNPEEHLEFLKAYVQGHADFDMGIVDEKPIEK